MSWSEKSHTIDTHIQSSQQIYVSGCGLSLKGDKTCTESITHPLPQTMFCCQARMNSRLRVHITLNFRRSLNLSVTLKLWRWRHSNIYTGAGFKSKKSDSICNTFCSKWCLTIPFGCLRTLEWSKYTPRRLTLWLY